LVAEDVDAELFRLLVEARAAQVNCVDQPSKKTNKLSAVKPDIVQTAEPHDSV
jgi:hypothetical protein